jgi:pimeloyl-ACP methyl ester carboxylesterase
MTMTLPHRARLCRSTAVLLGLAALLAGCGGGASTAAGSAATGSATTPASPASASATSAGATSAGASPGSGPLEVYVSRDVLTAPTKVAKTALGPVGYRELGAGPPLLLIMGLGGSMDAWQPVFLAALAQRHRVVLLDNAGVGETAALTAPLTITEMADQTSDLITALRLGRTAVLGWSMGGMIAQALAVLHPAQVSRLILAATQPGTGKSLPIPAAAAAAAAGSNPAGVLSVLFPASASAAQQAYALGILRYPGFYQAPRAVIADQGLAVQQWIAGQDPAGRRLTAVRLPALVADGTVDQLNPVANDRTLAGEVPGAKLILYPGAGHAFLFQDMSTFLPAVQNFLG